MSICIKLIYKLNLTDLTEGLGLANWGTKGRIIRMFLLFVIAPVTIGYLFTKSEVTAFVYGPIFGISFFVILQVVMLLALFRIQHTQASVRDIVLTDEGYESKAGEKILYYPWDEITQVLELPRAYYLIRGEVPVATVEKSSLEDSATAEQVHSLLQRSKPITTFSSTFLAFDRCMKG